MPITHNTGSASKMQSSTNTGGDNTHHTTTGMSTGDLANTSHTDPTTGGSRTTSKLQSAKNAAREFLHRDQHHNTEVREHFKPAVVKEVVQPIEREEVTTAVDRELHQDHYQTRIQPVADNVVVPEQHHHSVLPVEQREVRHGKDHDISRALQDEAARFKSTHETLPTQYESASSGTVAGEHVHHHVHETVQPVIEREVIQPTVIHTTKPIHERIEHEPTFHPATVQPKMTLDEFKTAGGVLEGKPEVRDFFEGEPQVRENGGADQTHPNGRMSREAHMGTGHTGVRQPLERQHTPPVRA